MLSFNFSVQQAINDCSVFVFTDKTGLYSETNLGGYGIVNAYRDSLTFTVIRTGADGQTLKAFLQFGTDNIATLCGSDWVGGDMPCDCGCNEIVLEKPCPEGFNKDGCYTYSLEVTQTIGGAVTGTKTISVLHTCNTRKRIRKANRGLSMGCGAENERLLAKWVRAYDFFRSVIEKQEVCCEEDSAVLEQVDLILNSIGY